MRISDWSSDVCSSDLNSGASACLCVRSFLFCHEGLLMSAYKDPSFQERTALARQARQKALDQLKAKPPADEAVLAERNAARIARERAKADEGAANRDTPNLHKAEEKTREIEAAKTNVTPPCRSQEET